MVIEEMTSTECLNMLSRARIGRLACAHENQPYVVPIYFVFEELRLYGFTTPGLKTEWMRSNPLVCIEVDEVKASDQWWSIILFGKYEELPSGRAEPRGPLQGNACSDWSTHLAEQEREHALELLQRHADWWEPGCASGMHRHSENPLTPVFYRIHIDRITGRQAKSGPSTGHQASAHASADQTWLGRILHNVITSLRSA